MDALVTGDAPPAVTAIEIGGKSRRFPMKFA
jgi:hypothetical protein